MVYGFARVAALFLGAVIVSAQTPLASPPGKLSLLLFVLADCPISRRLAPEFRRICNDYSPRGVSCTLVFVDPDTKQVQARQHLKDFALEPMPFIIDTRHQLVQRTGATVTPEAAVLDSNSRLLYLGRIDDSHVSWTKSRPATRHDLRDALDSALAGRAVPRPRTEAIGCYISPLPSDSDKD